ncbi:carbon-nitrogen hydrolase family protein [Rhodoferax sp. GW822-FHT02A01]|uniref:carbon-nitrogen hydrolase family protein n=1 Tax=Rhodoferax sp. GW822-FHT02A01 TaxID=3141537 RepID=UPI00315CD654
MKVAAIQMISTGVVQENLNQARTLLEQAAQRGAELAVLPEYFCLIGQRDADKLAIQEAFGKGPIQDFLSETARTLGLWIVAGTLPLSASAPDKVFNSSLVFNPQGMCVARYDKIHLFRFDNGREQYDESRVLDRGNTPVRFALPSRDGHTWQIGMSVCYDLRFSELYRSYATEGVDLLLVPAAFTHTTGKAHWEVLLRARAIENLAFVAAAAQGGTHPNGRQTWGQSILIDPWGHVLAQQAQDPGVVIAELDAQAMQQWRSQLPSLQHRIL